MACLLIGSAAKANVCRIQHYLDAQIQSEKLPYRSDNSLDQWTDHFLFFLSAVLM